MSKGPLMSNPSRTGQKEEKRKTELGSMAEKFRESTGRREETTEREAHPGPGGFKETPGVGGLFHHFCFSSNVYLLRRLRAT